MRNWISTTLKKELPGPTEIFYGVTDFIADVQLSFEGRGFSRDDIGEMEIPEFVREIERWRAE